MRSEISDAWAIKLPEISSVVIVESCIVVYRDYLAGTRDYTGS